MTNVTECDWLLLLPRVPAEPSRHRVALWRELRKIGAVPAASGAWTVPAVPPFTEGLDDARALAERGGGTLAVFTAVPGTEADLAVLAESFASVRRDEWAEFEADCGKFDDEIAKEIAKEKFTFGELEEEEQSMERLRRWFRDLKQRDVLRLPEALSAETRLAACAEALADFAERVFAAQLPASGPEDAEHARRA
ncbi:Chromate resistance protein ChrB [Leucobacter sp. M11]|uniref:Chromate resistance protein ChrB n=1 Tax=Leucobacter sp. M11 TaxID=2993565 RepID=UPI002D7ED162|nr:Chromate resistance protein ChrB [Leucobacter sp. M11]MEB4613553.1 chromate resistance protein ChrB [Leucobacter sp. M11]